jgi:cellulase/cellobiase CelA1
VRRAPVLLTALAVVVLAAAATAVGPMTLSAQADTSTAAVPYANPIPMTSGLFVDPDSVPNTWVNSHQSDSRAAQIKSAIGNRSIAKWFGNVTSGTIGTAVGAYVGRADNADKLPVLVAYNLPERDACGGHSGGGAASPAAYRTWIAAFASAIGTRPAVVILEPDAFGDYDCMTAAQRTTRNSLLTFATQQLRDRAVNTYTYLDAGNAGWVAANVMASRLNAAGVGNIRGFAVNVSNYYTTAQSVTYANNVNRGLSAPKTYVIDTSRNGNGHNGQWCNPPGRRLGTPPQIGGAAELLLWIKTPGSSDGNCGIAPNTPAGTFSPDIAMRLINGT